MYEIVATPVFKVCLDRLIHFLEIKYSSQIVRKTKTHIRKALANKLSENPHIAPVSDRLIDIGITDYRQYAVDEHNYAVGF